MTELRQLHPSTNPHDDGVIDVGGGHRLFWESHGASRGSPVLHLCGGPGGTPSRQDARYFNPFSYRIVLLHARGCGRSTPHASIENNTLDDLISDIEVLRTELGIDRWVVSGASWGTTLALVYAQRHPERVKALILRGVFLGTERELDWLYEPKIGAAGKYPEGWDRFTGWTEAHGRHNLLAAYGRALHCGDVEIERMAAARWCEWEDRLAGLEASSAIDPVTQTKELAQARLSVHYFLNNGFLKPNQILDNAAALHGIPGTIVQGSDDDVTPAMTASALHMAWPDSVLHLVPGATHSTANYPEMVDHVMAAAQRYA